MRVVRAEPSGPARREPGRRRFARKCIVAISAGGGSPPERAPIGVAARLQLSSYQPWPAAKGTVGSRITPRMVSASEDPLTRSWTQGME